MIARLATSVLSMLALVSCAGLVAPRPSTTEYFQSEFAGFSIDTANRTIHYVLLLSARSTLPDGSVLEATFENPAGARPLIGAPIPDLKDGKVGFKSTPVHGLRLMGVYESVVRVYSDESRSKLLSTHMQNIRSEINQSDLPGY